MRWNENAVRLTLALLIGLLAALTAQALVAAVVHLNRWLLIAANRQ